MEYFFIVERNFFPIGDVYKITLETSMCTTCDPSQSVKSSQVNLTSDQNQLTCTVTNKIQI